MGTYTHTHTHTYIHTHTHTHTHTNKQTYIHTHTHTPTCSVEVAQSYLARVDVLRMLHVHGFGPLPPLEDLAFADCALRLRNKLMEDDKMDMAMEVLHTRLHTYTGLHVHTHTHTQHMRAGYSLLLKIDHVACEC